VARHSISVTLLDLIYVFEYFLRELFGDSRIEQTIDSVCVIQSIDFSSGNEGVPLCRDYLDKRLTKPY